MTIDERLEKLTERHEALTQSVELLALETRHNLNVLTTSMRDLVQLVRSHEQRLSNLEQS